MLQILLQLSIFVFFASFLDQFVSCFDMVLGVFVLMWFYEFHLGHQNVCTAALVTTNEQEGKETTREPILQI